MKPSKHQHGAALLIILAIIMVTIVVLVTSSISVNELRNNATKKSLSALNQARSALLGYSLRSIPMGKLPCPDNNGDGIEDFSGNNCSTQLGRLPYKTLMLEDVRDGYNTSLWYALNLNLRSNGSATKNSSTPTALNLDGLPLAAVIISASRPLSSQSRNGNISTRDYLEGINANANTNDYSRVNDDLHNDILLAINNSEYWTLIEQSILKHIAIHLKQYKTACGEYPWASSNGLPPYNSINALQQGAVPFDSALPENWNNGCASGIQPLTWLASSWGNQIHYAMCTSPQGNCLNVSGDLVNSSSALVIAPGIALTGQSRPSFSLNDFFENINSVSDNNFIMRFEKNFDGGFNDVVLSLSP